MTTLVIEQLCISQAADTGDPYDAAGDLTAGISEALRVQADPGNALMELPPVDYNLEHTKPLLLVFNMGWLGRPAY